MHLMNEMSIRPTIIFLSEYSTGFDVTLKEKFREYYQCGKPEDSPFGLALYSTFNDVECTINFLGDSQLFPYIRAETDHVVVYGIHPPPPVSQAMANIRDDTLNHIAAEVRKETKPVVVMGDMNISPYSPVFRRFTKEARLFETKNRLIPTWWIGMINIDHILVTNPDLKVSRVGWWRGSDHRPVFLTGSNFNIELY